MANLHDGELWTIDAFVSGFANNAYLIASKESGLSVIIDTPDEPHELIAAARDTAVAAILITHNHWDHLEGFDDVVAEFAVPVGVGADDADKVREEHGYNDLIDVGHGTMLEFGDIKLRCIFTPGHTPGSTCYLLPAESPGAVPHLFAGDTLFPGGPGRSVSPAALGQMLESIRAHLHTLPTETAVLPGHGDRTTIEASIAESADFPYWDAASRPADLSGDVAWAMTE